MPDRPAAPGRTALAWAIGLGAGSIVFAFVMSGLGGDLAEPASTGNDSYSYSAVGHRAFATLLTRLGVTVERHRTRHWATLDRNTAVMVAEPDAVPDLDAAMERRLAALRLLRLSLTQHAPLVIVLPKRGGLPDAARPRWIANSFPLRADSAVACLRPFGITGLTARRGRSAGLTCDTRWGPPLAVSLADPQLLDPAPGLEPIATCGSRVLIGRIVAPRDSLAAWVPRRADVYVVSDPDLIANAGLGPAHNADVMAGFLTRHLRVSVVRFDETVHHPVLESNLATELLRFPLVLALVQAALVAAALLWAASARFGKARPANARDESKRALVESIAGLIVATGRPVELLESYLGQMLKSVADHYGIAAPPQQSRLLDRLARLAAERRVTVDIAAVGATVDALHVANRMHAGTVVRAARDIHHWHREMTHDR